MCGPNTRLSAIILKKLHIFLGLCGFLLYLSGDLGKSCIGFIELQASLWVLGPEALSVFRSEILHTHMQIAEATFRVVAQALPKTWLFQAWRDKLWSSSFRCFAQPCHSEPTLVLSSSSFHFWTTLSGLSFPWSENAFKSFLVPLCGSGINLTAVIYGHLNPMTLPLRAKNNLGVKEQLRPRPKKAEAICFCLSLRKSTGSLCLSSSVSFSEFFTSPVMICFSYSEYFSLFYSCCHHFRRAAQSGGQTSASGSGLGRRYDGSFFILPQAE